ncbi:MAG: hypothetical protein H6Q68_281 [Firmicutes bacterium]|nr:hypothetical protein [Bacillota bacterium]
MSNQVLLWAMVIIPLLSLFLMKKEDIRRYIPAGLFSSFLLVILQEVGVANSWWYFRETIYPLAVFTPFTESVDLIIPMWVLKYTYGRFWHYILFEIVGNVAFFFIILPWFASRGIMSWPAYAGLIAFIFSTVINLLVYRFHMWQEDVFGCSEKTEASVAL